MTRRPRQVPLPTKEQVLAYLRESPVPVARREIARAFNIRGDDRVWLKELLAELKRDGTLEPRGHRRMGAAGHLPEVGVVEVEGTDEDGEILARPANWRGESEPPTIFLAPDKRGRTPVKGERILARLRLIEGGRYEALPIRHLGTPSRRIVGVFEKGRRGGLIRPTNRQHKENYEVGAEETGGAEEGELVLAEPKALHRRGGETRQARILERLGDASHPRALSLVAIAEHALPDVFPEPAIEEAEAAGPARLGDRLDLRSLPLVTIDGEDARDFDDAVFAEPDGKGFRLVVAIADVAHYVRPEGALDREARRRGNSAYFPDRVVPMLPEALSNGWCSLKPGEDRPCLAVELFVDAEGRLQRHRFHRALMRSAARLTYEQVQAAADGRPDDRTAALLEPVIRPLYAGFGALEVARRARGTLDLDLPERRVHLNPDGSVRAILPRDRLDSHRLIEAYMVLANVAAAEALESRRQPCMYRVHEPPDPAKVEALRQVLEGLDLGFPRGAPITPKLFTRVLDQVAGSDAAPMVSELVLRAQSQARYQPENLGHFGLALQRYAHFTSPIRRYSDLLVHRALIGGFGLGEGGLPQDQAERFADWGEQISMTERRAAAAERDAVDRFTALFLSASVGTLQPGRVTAVTHFGLFVRLDESGADGLVPVSSLPDDYYDHDERRHALVGRRWGRSYHLGARVVARLDRADPLTGSLTLSLVEGEAAPSTLPPARRPKAPPHAARRGGRIGRGVRKRS